MHAARKLFVSLDSADTLIEGGAALNSINFMGGLRFAPFAKGGLFFLVHPRLCTGIDSFLFPSFERTTVESTGGELCGWGRRSCRTYGAAEFLRGLEPSAYALG